jgi:multidrug efflux pump subunit AcrA (membrane-fusion protein)
MNRIFNLLPTVVVASGIAGWAMAQVHSRQREAQVAERAQVEMQSARQESERIARRLTDLLASADRVIISRRPESGPTVESVQDRTSIAHLFKIISRAEPTATGTWTLMMSDTVLNCIRGTETVLSLMPLGNVWKVSAGDLSGEFIVDDAAGAAMDSFLRANLQPPVAP